MSTDLDLEVAALHPADTPAHVSLAILGAMAGVAEAGQAPARSEDVDMITSAWQFIFGQTFRLHFSDGLARVEPELLASLVTPASLREDAIKFMTVVTFVDGVPERAKVDAVRRYAAALDIGRPVDLLGLASTGHMKDALAEMTRLNMDSITNGQWAGN